MDISIKGNAKGILFVLYFQCKCCQTDVGTVQDTFPDICIAYKLHLECGRLINLYDWLQVSSFHHLCL